MIEKLAEVLNELLAGSPYEAQVVNQLVCTPTHFWSNKLPEDLIASPDGGGYLVSVLGMINTAAVRADGADCVRLIAIVDEDTGKVSRFEAGPYNPPAT